MEVPAAVQQPVAPLSLEAASPALASVPIAVPVSPRFRLPAADTAADQGLSGPAGDDRGNDEESGSQSNDSAEAQQSSSAAAAEPAADPEEPPAVVQEPLASSVATTSSSAKPGASAPAPPNSSSHPHAALSIIVTADAAAVAEGDVTPPLTPAHGPAGPEHQLTPPGQPHHQYTPTPTHEEIDWMLRGTRSARSSATDPATPVSLQLSKSRSFSRRESVLWSPHADGEDAPGLSDTVSTPSHSVLGTLDDFSRRIAPEGGSPPPRSRGLGGLLPDPRLEQEMLRVEIQRNYAWGRVTDLYD